MSEPLAQRGKPDAALAPVPQAGELQGRTRAERQLEPKPLQPEFALPQEPMAQVWRTRPLPAKVF
jgi:hypothetical protein